MYANSPKRLLADYFVDYQVLFVVIAAIITIPLMIHIYRHSERPYLAVFGFLIGQSIGRWGNFTNQEAFGTNTNMPWGMYSPKVENYLIEHQTELLDKGIHIDTLMPDAL